MIHKVVVVPIDDRPCHNSLTQKAMEDYDTINLVYPERECLGHFMESGNTDKLQNFIIGETKDADLLILSMDALLFGGLVQARSSEDNINYEYYKQTLRIIEQTKLNNPSLKIFSYSVIMRLTTTVTDSNNLSVWEDIFEYSQLVHKSQINEKYKEQLKKVKNRIPVNELNKYLSARTRNHWINKEFIELINKGVINYGTLVQEDTTEFGMHINEQNILKKLIESRCISDKVTIKNGTDEMVALLLARYINKETLTINLDKTFVDDKFIAKYEDRPVIENILHSLSIANMEIGQSDLKLFVTPTQGESNDLCFEEIKSNLSINMVVKRHLKETTANKIAVLDVKNANGGDLTLLEDIYEVLGNKLVAYSAWNTASNAIGTLLLDISIINKEKANKEYLKYRVVDDAIYQGKVRFELNHWMKENGFDVWANNDSDKPNDRATELINEAIKKSPIIDDKSHLQIKLPWGRSFEIEIGGNDEERI